MRVYIAGPISKGDVVRNIRTAINAAEELRKRGHFPFVPHLTTFTWYFLHADNLTLTDDAWGPWNTAWLDCCEAVLRLPGESTGSDKEVKHAEQVGIPVFYGIPSFKASPLW